jgi:hypothetical protein
MPSSRPPQLLSFRGPNPVRFGGDPMWIAAGKPMLPRCDPPAIALVHAGVSRDNAAWMEAAIHPEESGFTIALTTVPASVSITDRRAFSLGMRRPSHPYFPMIPNLFPDQRSRYAVA